MYVKAFIINVNKCLEPFFLEQHINIVNRVTLQCFWFIFSVKWFGCSSGRHSVGPDMGQSKLFAMTKVAASKERVQT